jgi:hypothetical protein
VPTTIRTGPRSTELDGLDKAIDSHPIWTELRGPDTSRRIERRPAQRQRGRGRQRGWRRQHGRWR